MVHGSSAGGGGRLVFRAYWIMSYYPTVKIFNCVRKNSQVLSENTIFPELTRVCILNSSLNISYKLPEPTKVFKSLICYHF